MISVDDVKAALRVEDVLDRFGIAHRDRPQIRLRECPGCREPADRGSVVVDRESGRWCHHSGLSPKCKGDLLELVAGLAGIDRKRELPRLLEVAAPIAGITEQTDTAELQRIREKRHTEQLVYERERAARRAAAVAKVPTTWDRLARGDERGKRYLDGRGINSAELVAADVVRFDRSGNPCVRLFDGDAPVNILRRQLSGEPKVLAMADCPTDGTIAGRVAELDRQGPDVAVLTEGVADTLTAITAFAGCVVVGANGIHRIADVAARVVPMLVEVRGWLLLVPHNDNAGITAMIEAKHIAEQAGLVLDRDLHVVDLGDHKDLNVARHEGWRWDFSNCVPGNEVRP